MARTIGSFAEQTGPRIREAAQELFARHGFAAVSMRQIAARVGVQVGAIYQYTPDKQSLLFRIMDDHMDALLAAWAEARGGDTAPARLDAFTAFHVRYHLARPDEVFIAYMELRSLDPANFEAIEAKRRAYEAELQSILSDGAAAGVFTVEDARLTTMAIIAMLTGVTTWYRAGGRLDAAEIERLYVLMVRRMVGAVGRR